MREAGTGELRRRGARVHDAAGVEDPLGHDGGVIGHIILVGKRAMLPGRACYRHFLLQRDGDAGVEGGREFRTVEIDQERAPLVRWAFEAYATGFYTVRQLVEELRERGLTIRPGPVRPAKPISRNGVSKMLNNPYYVGMVTYRDARYHRGNHEPLIAKDLFHRVQNILAAHNHAGEKQRTHHHYL